jgi:hypothetical protein
VVVTLRRDVNAGDLTAERKDHDRQAVDRPYSLNFDDFSRFCVTPGNLGNL